MFKKAILGMTMIATAVFAMNSQAFQLSKSPIIVSAVVTKSGAPAGATKKVTLMNIQLTSKERNTLLSYQPQGLADITGGVDPVLPSSVTLGMNGVPVLDQGAHGSCVTFANTAAIDAVIGKGDYVSQLCSLSLGSYLQDNAYQLSGWDGSWGSVVLSQVDAFGIINKKNQLSQSCGGLTHYPLNDSSNQGGDLTVEQAKGMSEPAPSYWVPRMNAYNRIDNEVTDPKQGARVLTQVKAALAKGHRVTFGTFLVINNYCTTDSGVSVGACATHNATFDTWAITPEVLTPPMDTAGHEMVISGYDDNAVATDRSGKQYKGLLTLRNSWGTDVGDNGNYYMTYDYFAKFAMEVQEIVSMNELTVK